MPAVVVCALYKFVTLANYQDLRNPLHAEMEKLDIRGTLLLANEGINGTIAGTEQGIYQLLTWLKTDPRLNEIDYKLSFTDVMPFNRTKVKLKKEIVTMGIEGIDPVQVVGTCLLYTSPSPRD